MWAAAAPPIVDREGELLLPRRCLGDEESVVIVVVAVCGRSPDPLDTASPDVVGNLPVSSSFRILDFRSSSSSQTVEGAVVEAVDSVSAARGVSGELSSPVVRATAPLKATDSPFLNSE